MQFQLLKIKKFDKSINYYKLIIKIIVVKTQKHKNDNNKITIIIIIIIMIKRQYQPPSPKKKHLYNTLAVFEWKPSTVVPKTSTLEVAGILDPPHFYVSVT